MTSSFLIAFHVATSFTFAIIFFAAGVSKLRNHMAFRDIIIRYEIVPVGVARMMARVLPLLEITIALLWIIPQLHFLAAIITIILLTCFIIAVIYNLWRDRAIPCGCDGIFLATKIGWHTVVRNVCLNIIALMVIGTAAKYHMRNLYGFVATEEVLLIVGLVVLLLVVIQAIDQILFIAFKISALYRLDSRSKE